MAITAVSTEVSSTATAAPRPPRRSNPVVLWHLLSLDAPTVAALWTWFLAASNHVHLPAVSVLAMAVAVWMLYVTDRLLDTRAFGRNPDSFHNGLEERHFFHRANGRRFGIGIVFAVAALAWLISLLPRASIRLYGILGVMLFGYFVLIHVPVRAYRLPKELAVGIFFSAATFIPTISRQPALRLVLLPVAILFAVLCSLNCLFIYAWEHSEGPSIAHPATRFALRFVVPLAATAVVSGLVLAFAPYLPWQVPAACSASAGLLLLLNGNRGRFAPSMLRAAADLCLLTPLLLLFPLR